MHTFDYTKFVRALAYILDIFNKSKQCNNHYCITMHAHAYMHASPSCLSNRSCNLVGPSLRCPTHFASVAQSQDVMQ